MAITAASLPTPAQALRTALQSTSPLVIELQTDVDLGSLRNHSNQALISPTLIASGVGTIAVRSHKTLFSAAGHTLRHGEFVLDNVENVIFRNVRFHGLWEWDDATAGDYDRQSWDLVRIVNGSRRIWIDRCEFGRSYDGQADIMQGADRVTLSWSRFLGGDLDGIVSNQINHREALDQANPANPNIAYYASRRATRSVAQIIAAENYQKKCSLVGAGDNQPEVDGGLLNVTYHHNYFHLQTQRMPRMRYGNAHVFINDINDCNGTAIASTSLAAVLIENQYFRNVSTPWSISGGTLIQRGSVRELNGTTGLSFPNQNPADASTFVHVAPRNFAWANLTTLPYAYTLHSATFTRDNLAWVGPVVPADAAETALLRGYLANGVP